MAVKQYRKVIARRRFKALEDAVPQPIEEDCPRKPIFRKDSIHLHPSFPYFFALFSDPQWIR